MGDRKPTGHEKTVLATGTQPLPDRPAATPGRRCPTCGGDFPADFVVCPRDATPLSMTGGEDKLLGAVLGGTYRFLRVIAEGGMGRLYEAEHVRLERKLAIKVLHELYAKSADGVARFEREARATAQIRSDYLVEVIDILRTPDGRPCIVSELLEGEDLQVRLDRLEKLPLGEAIQLTRQICRALSDAHAHGIVHRDLKPSNIFLQHGRVKILDFGVAKTAEKSELTQTGAVLGTPAYMAPEQARGSADVDARADLYAAGACLYRMLTGQPPYGKEVTNPLARLLHEEPARPRSLDKAIPEGVEAVIQHAMARDAADRPATALDLDEELSAFDAGTPAPSPVPASAPTTMVIAPEREKQATIITRRAKRARPVAIGIIVATMLAGGLGVAAVLGAMVRAVNHAAVLTSTERFLVILVASAVALTTGVLLIRGLRPRWRSASAVGQLTERATRGLVVGLLALGGLELLGRGLGAFANGTWLASAGAAAVWIGLAAVLAVTAVWRARR